MTKNIIEISGEQLAQVKGVVYEDKVYDVASAAAREALVHTLHHRGVSWRSARKQARLENPLPTPAMLAAVRRELARGSEYAVARRAALEIAEAL